MVAHSEQGCIHALARKPCIDVDFLTVMDISLRAPTRTTMGIAPCKFGMLRFCLIPPHGTFSMCA